MCAGYETGGRDSCQVSQKNDNLGIYFSNLLNLSVFITVRFFISKHFSLNIN